MVHLVISALISFSSYIRQDVIRRLLEGIDGHLSVLQLMGVTDIDDKIIFKGNQVSYLLQRGFIIVQIFICVYLLHPLVENALGND